MIFILYSLSTEERAIYISIFFSQRKMHDDINFWGLRPVTKVMSNTAAAEVLPLVPYLYEELCGYVDFMNIKHKHVNPC